MRLQLEESDPAFQALERWDAGNGLLHIRRHGQEELMMMMDGLDAGMMMTEGLDIGTLFHDKGTFSHRFWRKTNAADGAGRSAV